MVLGWTSKRPGVFICIVVTDYDTKIIRTSLWQVNLLWEGEMSFPSFHKLTHATFNFPPNGERISFFSSRPEPCHKTDNRGLHV